MLEYLTYESAETVSLAVRNSVERAAEQICGRYQWLAARPGCMDEESMDGELMAGGRRGCSPIWLHPWPPGVVTSSLTGESAIALGSSNSMDDDRPNGPSLPEGRLPQLVSALTELSQQWGITWRLSWNDELSRAGTIQDGRCDAGIFDCVLARAEDQRTHQRYVALNSEPVVRDPNQMRLADTLIDIYGSDLSRIGIRLTDDSSPNSGADGDEEAAPETLPFRRQFHGDASRNILPFRE